MGVPPKIMRAHCAVIRPDHFKFASYGPVNTLHLKAWWSSEAAAAHWPNC